MVEIALTQNQVSQIDDGDLRIVCTYKWCSQKTEGGRWYAVTSVTEDSGKKKRIYLHRLLMNPPEGFVVDHIDGDPLNNRRSNLRVCTHSQHIRAGNHGGTGRSKFRGIQYVPRGKKHWQATIRHGGRLNYLGVFDTELEAARARDKAALDLLGAFATLNLMEEAA